MAADASQRVCHFKLVLLGDTAVGKSCIVVRFVRDEFFDFQEPTIGAAFQTQSVQLDNHVVKFEIWDTAGQERYHSLAPMYYREAMAAVVVYDITNRDSFESAKRWIKELQQRGSPGAIIALTGNKADLETHRRVPAAEAGAYAQANGAFHFETSAKNAVGIKQLFREIAERLPKEKPQASAKNTSFPIIPPKQRKRESDTCC